MTGPLKKLFCGFPYGADCVLSGIRSNLFKLRCCRKSKKVEMVCYKSKHIFVKTIKMSLTGRIITVLKKFKLLFIPWYNIWEFGWISCRSSPPRIWRLFVWNCHFLSTYFFSKFQSGYWREMNRINTSTHNQFKKKIRTPLN